MFASSSPGKSVDDLPALSPRGRSEFVWHSTNRQGRASSRRDSVASSIRSVGGTLDSSSGGWNNPVFESGQNAISTLLQPPIIRTGLQGNATSSSAAHKPPTARDIPPVTLTNIPHVDNEEFSSYVSQFGALYEQLRRIRESEADGSSTRRGSKQDDATEGTADGYLRPNSRPGVARKGSTASLSSVNSVESPNTARRGSTFGRKTAQGPSPLSTIPTVYFDDDFHLENPRTFDVVSERSEVIPAEKTEGNGIAPAPRKALATNAILQEKLSWYMDTIEIHLINSISTASTTFFTALGSLKELHSEAAESVKRIKMLRTELKALDEEVVTQGLEIVQARKRQENLRQLHDAVMQLRRIIDAVASCEELVDAGEVDKALEGIDSLEGLITGERKSEGERDSSFQFRDLSQASALQGVNADLATLRLRIGKAYEAQFINILISDLKRHVESVAPSEVLLRWSNSASRARGSHGRSPSVFPSYLSSTDELKARLFPAMLGLHRAHYLPNAVAACREAILREIRSLIRRPLPSSNDDDNESMMSASTAGGGRHMSSQEKSSILARNLRALDPEDAEELLTKIYLGVAETLRRLTTQNKVILDVASSVTESLSGDGLRSPSIKSPPMSPQPDRHIGNPHAVAATLELQEQIHNALDVTSLLGQAVDVANDKITKILKVRSEQACTLPLDFFLRYFTLNLYFSTECEAISGRSGTSLKNVVNGHIKDFVQKTRDSEMQKLAQGMELDQWAAKDFTDQNTELLNQILESSTHDNPAWTDRTRLWIPYHELDNSNGTTAPEPETNGTTKARTAAIDSEKFVLPNSAVLCLEGLGNFLHLITGIPSMTTDIATSLISYLQLFNSRCTQLILGAGATRSAGLKNITSKHLALASQALSFIATLMPHIREFVRRHAGSGAGVSGLMGEFDKVRRLLQEHQNSIHQKLVDIMTGRAAAHAKSMRAIDWVAKTTENAHPYMETLVKETSTLHRVLTRHLPEMSITMIMSPVFSSYEDHLGRALDEADPKTPAGHHNMEIDIQYFISKLSSIDGFGKVGDNLTAKVEAKKVVEPEVKQEVKPDEADTTETKESNEGESSGDSNEAAANSGEASETKDDA